MTILSKRTGLFQVIVLLAIVQGCGTQPTKNLIENRTPAVTSNHNQTGQEDSSTEDGMEKILERLENAKLDVYQRITAANSLGKMKEFVKDNGPSPVPRMLALLPGDWDALTLEIVVSLGELGDPNAVPILQRMENPTEIEVHSKLRLAIKSALEKLRPVQKLRRTKNSNHEL